MITVTFNDTEVTIPTDSNLQELIIKLQANHSYSAIAINQKFVSRSDYESTLLSNGDIIHQVTPMQGG